jgi:hypothetical protein
MADTTDRILMRYQSQDFNKVIAEQQSLGKVYDQTAKAQDKVNASATKLSTKLSKLGSFGRDLRQAGGFLGSDTLMALGNFADGLSDVGQSIDAVDKKGSKLSKLFSVGGGIAAIAGAGLGSKIYDATIGQAQGTNTETILWQIGELIKAGFNVDTLRVQAQQAFLQAQEAEQFGGLQKDLGNIGKSRLDQLGFYTGPRDEEGMRAALKMAEEYIKTAPEWKPALPGEKELLNYKLIGEVMAAGLREELQKLESTRAQEANRKANTASWQSAMGRTGNIFSAGQSMLQAGSTFQNRQAGARNVYASALYAIEQETGQKRAEIIKNYSQSLLQLDQDYYAQRQQVAEQYGVETARLEADHQKSIKRMQEDHQGRLKKLVESRDALAVEDEIEAFNKERGRAEEDYAIMMQERQADYAAQLREMEQAHQQQKAERARQYQEQLRDLAVQAQQRRQQEANEYALLLRDILQTFTDARNEWAAQVNNSTNVTNNSNKNANVKIDAQGVNASTIESAVYGALRQAFS